MFLCVDSVTELSKSGILEKFQGFSGVIFEPIQKLHIITNQVCKQGNTLSLGPLYAKLFLQNVRRKGDGFGSRSTLPVLP